MPASANPSGGEGQLLPGAGHQGADLRPDRVEALVGGVGEPFGAGDGDREAVLQLGWELRHGAPEPSNVIPESCTCEYSAC